MFLKRGNTPEETLREWQRVLNSYFSSQERPNLKGVSCDSVTVTDTYTISKSEFVIVCNKSTAMTINLPTATGSKIVLIIKNINTGAVTVDGSSTDTIDGSYTQTINQWDSILIQDYAVGQWIILVRK